MKSIFRILVLAVALVAGLTTVSAQTVQVVVSQKVATLPTAASNYLDDPFRYFNVQLIVTGAGSDGIDIFYDVDFSVNEGDFYIRTKPGTVPVEPIHIHEGANLMNKNVLIGQLRNGRMETNIDYRNPLAAQQMPEGTYQLCMDIFRWSDKDNPNRVPISFGPCNSFEMCYSGSAPELVSPMSGAQPTLNGAMVVTPNRRINFFWTPVISNCAGNNPRFRYMLKVVKVLRGQNYQDAIKRNPTIFSAEVRNETFAVFDTLRDLKVQLEHGALYVAQVQAEPIRNNRDTDTYIIANGGNSQPMPFYWDEPDDYSGYIDGMNHELINTTGGVLSSSSSSLGKAKRRYGYVVDDESEEGEVSEGIEGVTVWDGGVEEVSGLETLLEEMEDQEIVGFSPNRHYVESDGYYTLPVSNDLEVAFTPARHEALKKISYAIEVYDYVSDDIDSITAYEPLFAEELGELPESHNQEVVRRTLKGLGDKLVQGNLYYMQLTSNFTAGYWDYSIADTSFYVNDMLAEHIHDTISREYNEDELAYPTGVFFQWGNDPDSPAFTTPQWKAPVDRSGDDIYAPANYEIPTSVPEVQKTKTFPVSWTPVKGVTAGDVVEYEVKVYELKPGQTLEEAVSENEALVTRTLNNTTSIPEDDTRFFKVFSSGKTYVMTLATEVSGDSDTIYHFENGNEALPVVIKIAK